MNKKKNPGFKTKSFVLKAKIEKEDVNSQWEPVIREYIDYYNKLSDWICDNLTKMTVGDLLKHVDGKHASNKYVSFFVDNCHMDKPLYWIFCKRCNPQAAQNLLYLVVDTLNIDGYNGNMLGINKSYYRREGYFKNVVGNYRTKMTTLNPKIKKCCLTEANSTSEELLLEQAAYEVSRNKIEQAGDWTNLIECLELKMERNEALIYRFRTLADYWKDNKENVENYIANERVAKLEGFGGCKRRPENLAMNLQLHASMSVVGRTDYCLDICLDKKASGKKKMTIDLMGHRKMVSVDGNGDRIENFDISSCGEYFTFQVERGSLYIILTLDIPYEKNPVEPKNIASVDANIKHMMLSTNIVDDRDIKGYVNIYKELLDNKLFCEACGGFFLKIYKDIASTVTFGMLEMNSLLARTMCDMYKDNSEFLSKIKESNPYKRELAIKEVMSALKNRYAGDYKVLFYLNSVDKMRRQYKSYFKLQEKYYELQGEYDNDMGFVDSSPSSKETMDPRRSDNPFIQTKQAQTILAKLRNIESKIVGCRDNIVTYAFDVLKNLGFDTIGVEYLDSSQFEKRKNIPTVKSLLFRHKLKGCDISVWNDTKWDKVRDNYSVVLDNEGKIGDFDLTYEGVRKTRISSFYNLVIKAIHFASIKDKFAQMSNNNGINIAFVPAAFTSQMDSINHNVYYIEELRKGKNGKMKKMLVRVDKKYVRTCQEKHVNGLNADYNASCNIAYLVQNEQMRDHFMYRQSGTDCYNSAEYMIRKPYKGKAQNKILNILKETGHIKVLTNVEMNQMKKGQYKEKGLA